MTTKEKKARKEAAKRHRINTPEVIMVAPETTGDQAAADATINTQLADDPPPIVSYENIGADSTDDLIPNEVATDAFDAAIEAAANEDRETFDDKMIAFGMNVETSWAGLCRAIGDKLKVAQDWIVERWMKWDSWADKAVTNLYVWAHKKNQELSVQWNLWFPKKATEAQLHAVVAAFAEKLTEQNKALLKAINGPAQVEASRVNVLLDAITKGHKTAAVKAYSQLTGYTLGASREAIEALA